MTSNKIGDIFINIVQIWATFESHNVFILHPNPFINLEHLVISKAAFFLQLLQYFN